MTAATDTKPKPSSPTSPPKKAAPKPPKKKTVDELLEERVPASRLNNVRTCLRRTQEILSSIPLLAFTRGYQDLLEDMSVEDPPILLGKQRDQIAQQVYDLIMETRETLTPRMTKTALEVIVNCPLLTQSPESIVIILLRFAATIVYMRECEANWDI